VPRILKTVVPRIRKSIEERGLLVSLSRSVLLPLHLLREYRETRSPHVPQEASAFDREYGVETDGEIEDWTYLSDLEIPSPNWIHGNNYAPVWPEQFRTALTTVPLRYEDYVFVDFGSGKGRALLLASEYPFKRIVGVEFSPELHAAAQRNISKYQSPRRKCAVVESMCADFLEFPLPLEPSVLFFFDPCDRSLLARMMARLSQSLKAHPRDLYLIYIAPSTANRGILDATEFLEKIAADSEQHVCVYRARKS
jgi:SAM-dependent methyltransferase